MPYAVKYYPEVAKEDIPRLSFEAKDRIRKAIESKLAVAPADFGLPLRKSLRGYWKLRVGDYRVVFVVQGDEVHVICIGHRREVYQIVGKRRL